MSDETHDSPPPSDYPLRRATDLTPSTRVKTDIRTAAGIVGAICVAAFALGGVYFKSDATAAEVASVKASSVVLEGRASAAELRLNTVEARAPDLERRLGEMNAKLDRLLERK